MADSEMSGEPVMVDSSPQCLIFTVLLATVLQHISVLQTTHLADGGAR